MARLGRLDYYTINTNYLLSNIKSDYKIWIKNRDSMCYEFYLDYAIKRFLREEH
jgi:glycine cleavage system protein P-like pyridoxal-binding family